MDFLVLLHSPYKHCRPEVVEYLSRQQPGLLFLKRPHYPFECGEGDLEVSCLKTQTERSRSIGPLTSDR